MSQTIARGKASVLCQRCRIVDHGGYDEDYRIAFCPLHAAAPELLKALQGLQPLLDYAANLSVFTDEDAWHYRMAADYEKEILAANKAVDHAEGRG